MAEDIIVKYASPTLAGLKTANLFRCKIKSQKELLMKLKLYNKILVPKGLRLVPMLIEINEALLYLYRPSKLREDLSRLNAKDSLSCLGYQSEKPEKCLARLRCKLNENGAKEFPHEIGFFLGYPPEDVVGFIKNRGACSKCTGCWKVYGDKSQAEKTFNMYKKMHGSLFKKIF